jgi:hypothetical protein
VGRVYGRFLKVIDLSTLSLLGLREVVLMKKIIAIILLGLVAFGSMAFAGPGLWKIPEDEITVDGGPGLWKIPEGY